MTIEMYDTVTDNRPEPWPPLRPTLAQFSAALNEHWDAHVAAHGGSYEATDYCIPAMGLMGEAGEAGEHFKKFVRDGSPEVFRNHELALELGDVIHYWCRLVNLAGYTPGEIMRLNEEKLAARRAAKAAK